MSATRSRLADSSRVSKGRILYVQYANPGSYPPIEYSSRILADEGWEIFVLGAHSYGPEALVLNTHPRIRCEVLPYIEPGWRQKIGYFRFLRRALQLSRDWKPDWIYVSDFLAAPVGLLLSRVLRYKTVYHEHDSPSPGEGASRFVRLAMAARKSLACAAELDILPQHERIRLFVEATATLRPVHCVWNCPPKRDVVGDVSRGRRPDEPLAVYFHGSINLDRVPLALIEGARMCGVPIRIRIVGFETIGSKGTIERLRAATTGSHTNVILEFPGPVSRAHLRQQMDGMHVGWINFINRYDDMNLLHLVGASNKAFDYLAAGLPIIVPDTTDWREFYVDPGYARACNPADPEGIAATLRWFYENPMAAAQMGKKGQQRIASEWNYETQFKKVFQQLNRKSKRSDRCPVLSSKAELPDG